MKYALGPTAQSTRVRFNVPVSVPNTEPLYILGVVVTYGTAGWAKTAEATRKKREGRRNLLLSTCLYIYPSVIYL